MHYSASIPTTTRWRLGTTEVLVYYKCPLLMFWLRSESFTGSLGPWESSYFWSWSRWIFGSEICGIYPWLSQGSESYFMQHIYWYGVLLKPLYTCVYLFTFSLNCFRHCNFWLWWWGFFVLATSKYFPKKADIIWNESWHHG